MDLFRTILMNGVTNASVDVLPIFENMSFSNNLIFYYQGCGSDITPLLLNGVENYVLSDNGAENQAWCSSIKDKLKNLEQQSLVRNLVISESMCKFYLQSCDPRDITIHFTDKSLDKIDFKLIYGLDLGVIYVKNSGSTTWDRAFWDGLRSGLIKGGYLLGVKISNSRPWIFHENIDTLELFCNNADHIDINCFQPDQMHEIEELHDGNHDSVKIGDYFYKIHKHSNFCPHIEKKWEINLSKVFLKYKGTIDDILEVFEKYQ